MTVELPDRWKIQLAEIFSRLAPEYEVWAYGSRVTGQCHPGSDLDLVLIHPQHPEQPCSTLLDIINALSESPLPICVDVMDWARVPVEFHEQMNRQRELLLPPSPCIDV